jgi:FkbM family methyltransferase
MMDARIRKIVRTVESGMPFVKPSFVKNAKESLFRHARRALRLPHERDFRALALLPPRDEECFLDVGANRGQSIESMLLFRPNARIVSFEANPALARDLAARYRDRKNVRIVATGLSDSAGTFPLFVPSYKGYVYDALASFDRGAAAGWISERTILGFDPRRLSIAEVPCATETLDAQGLAPHLIKVDVQGCEYNVLAGGKETLRRYQPILLVETYGSDTRTVRLAEDLGYEEYHFDGSFLRKGPPRWGPNSFLITASRMKTLAGVNPRSSSRRA